MISRFLLFLLFLFSANIFAEDHHPIVILYSDKSESYHAPAEAFIKKQSHTVLEYYLNDDGFSTGSAIMNNIMMQKPALIFALGARAAWFAKAATVNRLETKVIFAMVLNWQRYNLLDGQKNIVGISNDISPGTQLFNLSLLSPNVKRVGVIYSKFYSQDMIKQAKDATELLGLELIAEPTSRAEGFKRSWRKISQNIDAYWVLSDPGLYTLDNVHWLNNRCLREKIICIGQSKNITKLGVLLSINPDEVNLGVQAAALSKQIHDDVSGNYLGNIQAPIATTVTLNRRTANMIGIKIDKQVLSLVNHIVDE